MRKKKQPSKYPPYPGSNWDYAVKHTASMKLQKPNKVICIYCHCQGVRCIDLVHATDCPARDEDNGSVRTITNRHGN